jgi:hypothetical protein
MPEPSVSNRPVAKKKSKSKKTETVYILSYSGKNIVWPPVVVLDGDDTVEFHAVNTEATVFLKGALSFQGMAKRAELLEVPQRHILALKVKPNVRRKNPPGGLTPEGTEALAGVYPYSVYCDEGNDFAEGNSSPIMIIEPPMEEGGRGPGG